MYTKEDEKYGPEFRDIRREKRLIREELANYSWKIIQQFEETLPCPAPNSSMEVPCKEYVVDQKRIANLLETQPYNHHQEYYYMETIQYQTPENFWYRWNKFKKMMVFL